VAVCLSEGRGVLPRGSMILDPARRGARLGLSRPTASHAPPQYQRPWVFRQNTQTSGVGGPEQAAFALGCWRSAMSTGSASLRPPPQCHDVVTTPRELDPDSPGQLRTANERKVQFKRHPAADSRTPPDSGGHPGPTSQAEYAGSIPVIGSTTNCDNIVRLFETSARCHDIAEGVGPACSSPCPPSG